MGAGNQVGTAAKIESFIAQEISIFEAGIDFSSSTRTLSLFLNVSLRNILFLLFII
jgi:hypothetical protein